MFIRTAKDVHSYSEGCPGARFGLPECHMGNIIQVAARLGFKVVACPNVHTNEDILLYNNPVSASASTWMSKVYPKAKNSILPCFRDIRSTCFR